MWELWGFCMWVWSYFSKQNYTFCVFSASLAQFSLSMDNSWQEVQTSPWDNSTCTVHGNKCNILMLCIESIKIWQLLNFCLSTGKYITTTHLKQLQYIQQYLSVCSFKLFSERYSMSVSHLYCVFGYNERQNVTCTFIETLS